LQDGEARLGAIFVTTKIDDEPSPVLHFRLAKTHITVRLSRSFILNTL